MKIVNGVIIQNIKEHKEIKEEILKRIKKSTNCSYQSVSITDWNINNGVPRTYFTDILQPLVCRYYENIKKYYYGNLYKEAVLHITHVWFQTYKKNSSHKWHTHARAHFANVYYVALPNKEFGTKFLHEKNVLVKEGDLITFPAFLAHSSPVNLSKQEKVIISFNSDIEID